MPSTATPLLALSVTRSTRRKRTYEAPLRNLTLHALFASEGRQATAPEAGTTNTYLRLLESQGLVTDTGEVRSTGKPGRPPVIFKLTDKGVKRVRRALGEIR